MLVKLQRAKPKDPVAWVLKSTADTIRSVMSPTPHWPEHRSWTGGAASLSPHQKACLLEAEVWGQSCSGSEIRAGVVFERPAKPWDISHLYMQDKVHLDSGWEKELVKDQSALKDGKQFFSIATPLWSAGPAHSHSAAGPAPSDVPVEIPAWFCSRRSLIKHRTHTAQWPTLSLVGFYCMVDKTKERKTQCQGHREKCQETRCQEEVVRATQVSFSVLGESLVREVHPF